MTTPRITEYRHRSHNCGRLLFQGYLPPGAKVNIVCPKCGRMAIFTGTEPIQNVDMVQQVGVYSNGTAVLTAVTVE